MIWMISAVLFFSLFLFLYGIFGGLSAKERVIDKLDEYDVSAVQIEEKRMAAGVKSGPIQRIAKVLEGLPTSEKKRKAKALAIKQADMPITYEELFVMKLMGATSMGFLVLAITKNIFLMILVAFMVWVLPNMIMRSRKAKRIRAFDDQLNEGLVMISNALKAGYSFLQALAVAADETQDPFSKEFKSLLKELSLGMPIEDGLSNLIERVPSEDMKLIVNAILIQKDVGGNLSEILENIAETVRERQRIKNEINTLTAQGRLSGMIIMVMPVFLGAIIYLFSPEYITLLFQTMLGKFMLVLAVINQIMGWLFIRKIVNIEF